MADIEAKAKQTLELAEKQLASRSFFWRLIGCESDIGTACDLYNQAGHYFKVAKNWTAAGNAYLKSAELHATQSDSKHEVALDYDKSATCFRKVDPQKSVECLERASEIYVDMGRFNMAAKVNSTIAEIYESEAMDKACCIKHHQIAADFLKGEEAKNSANKSLLRVAQISAEIGDYRKAIDVFEEIANYEMNHPVLKFASKSHFFAALLCYLCFDLLDAQNALKRYGNMSPSFADSREYKLIEELTLCVEEQNVDHFTEAVQNYDKLSRFEPWQTSLLLAAKKHCGTSAVDDQEEEDLR